MGAADEPAPLSAAEAATLFADLEHVSGLLLAVSGGPDSTALLVLIARWRGALRVGPDLLAVTIDHGMRPQAREEAKAVGTLAARLGIPHRILPWRGDKPASGLQEAAREARYRLLAQAARRAGMDHIVTAHTLDDQAETVLFRLARGSGIAGLAGMARAAPAPGDAGVTILRPLLSVAKARLVATLDRAGIAYADDPSNRDPRFTRARLRTSMPLLAAEGLSAETLARAGNRARRANEAIEWAVAEIMQNTRPTAEPGQGRPVARVSEFETWPAEIALRVLGRHIGAQATEGSVELGKLEALLEDLQKAVAGRLRRWRRTLAGAVVNLRDGVITVTPAPPRRRPAGAPQGRMRAAAARVRGGAAVRRTKPSGTSK